MLDAYCLSLTTANDTIRIYPLYYNNVPYVLQVQAVTRDKKPSYIAFLAHSWGSRNGSSKDLNRTDLGPYGYRLQGILVNMTHLLTPHVIQNRLTVSLLLVS